MLRQFFKSNATQILLVIASGVFRLCAGIILALSSSTFFDILWQTNSSKGSLVKSFGIVMPQNPKDFLLVFTFLIGIRVCLTFLYRSSLTSLSSKYRLLIEPLLKTQLAKNNVVNNKIKLFEKGYINLAVDILFVFICFWCLFKINVPLAATTVTIIIALVFVNLFLFKGLLSERYFELKISPEDKLSTRKAYLRIKHAYNALKDVLLPLVLFLVFLCFFFNLLSVNDLTPTTAFLYVLMLVLIMPTIKNILAAQRVWMESSGLISVAKEKEL